MGPRDPSALIETLPAFKDFMEALGPVLTMTGITVGSPVLAGGVLIATLVMRGYDLFRQFRPKQKETIARRIKAYAKDRGFVIDPDAVSFFDTYENFIAIYDEVRARVTDIAQRMLARNTAIVVALCGTAIPDMASMPDYEVGQFTSNVDILDPAQVGVALAFMMLSPLKKASAIAFGDKSQLEQLDKTATLYDAGALYYLDKELGSALFGAGETNLEQNHREKVERFVREVLRR